MSASGSASGSASASGSGSGTAAVDDLPPLARYQRFVAEAKLTPEQRQRFDHVLVELDQLRRRPVPEGDDEDKRSARTFALYQRAVSQVSQILSPTQRISFRTQIGGELPAVVDARTAPFSDEDAEFRVVFAEFMRQFAAHP